MSPVDMGDKEMPYEAPAGPYWGGEMLQVVGYARRIWQEVAAATAAGARGEGAPEPQTQFPRLSTTSSTRPTTVSVMMMHNSYNDPGKATTTVIPMIFTTLFGGAIGKLLQPKGKTSTGSIWKAMISLATVMGGLAPLAWCGMVVQTTISAQRAPRI